LFNSTAAHITSFQIFEACIGTSLEHHFHGLSVIVGGEKLTDAAATATEAAELVAVGQFPLCVAPCRATK